MYNLKSDSIILRDSSFRQPNAARIFNERDCGKIGYNLKSIVFFWALIMPPLCKGRGTALAVEGLFFSLNSLSSRKVYRVSRSDTRKLVELFHRKCSLSQSEYSHSLVQSSIATQNLSYSFGKTCGGVFRRKTEGLFFSINLSYTNILLPLLSRRGGFFQVLRSDAWKKTERYFLLSIHDLL